MYTYFESHVLEILREKEGGREGETERDGEGEREYLERVAERNDSFIYRFDYVYPVKRTGSKGREYLCSE